MNLEFDRGTTRLHHTGWIAWIDDTTRKVHVRKGKCIEAGSWPVIETDDREYRLTVPNGRLQPSRVEALDMLAIDVRDGAENRMKPVQAQLNAIGRELLLDLVAIEMAKTVGEPEQAAKLLAERTDPKRLGQKK